MNKDNKALSAPQNQRQSGIELLRILSILMIVAVHYLGDGILYNVPFGSFNTIAARAIESLAIVCVNNFILISGYFGLSQKGINIRRIVDLIVMVAFWSGLFYALSVTVFKTESFSLLNFIKSLFPYMFGSLWFIRVYLLLTLLSPFLNYFLSSVNEKTFHTLVIILFVLFSLLPSFSNSFKNNNGYDIIHFIVMYIIGAYINKNRKNLPKAYAAFALYIIFAVITFIFSIYGNNIGYWAYDFIFVILESVCLFIAFLQINFRNRLINFIARSTLAVFILENSIAGLHDNIMRIEAYQESPYFLLHFAVCVIVFTAIALAADCIRRMIFSITIDKLLDKLSIINKRIFAYNT